MSEGDNSEKINCLLTSTTPPAAASSIESGTLVVEATVTPIQSW
jgi:hypothetical protein